LEAFCDVRAGAPELDKRSGEAKSELPLSSFLEVVEGGADVVEFDL
jgi:hypothetical protein